MMVYNEELFLMIFVICKEELFHFPPSSNVVFPLSVRDEDSLESLTHFASNIALNTTRPQKFLD